VARRDVSALALAPKLRMIAHVDAFLRVADDFVHDAAVWQRECVRNAAHAFARLYLYSAQFRDAERLLQQVLAVAELRLGPDSPYALDTVQLLGVVRRDMGELAEAETLFRRALAGGEMTLGADLPATLNAIHSRDNPYYDRGELAKAAAMYQPALAGGK
jgi:tetratricopeptide (TPR) repeat protein